MREAVNGRASSVGGGVEVGDGDGGGEGIIWLRDGTDIEFEVDVPK